MAVGTVVSIFLLLSKSGGVFGWGSAAMVFAGFVIVFQTKKLVLDADERLAWGPAAVLKDWSALNTSDQYKLALTDSQLIFGAYLAGETAQQTRPLSSIDSVSKAGWLSVRIQCGSETLRFRFARPGVRNAFVDALTADGVSEIASTPVGAR